MVKVVCIDSIVIGSPPVTHQPGEIIEIDDFHLPRLLALGAVRLVDEGAASGEAAGD